MRAEEYQRRRAELAGWPVGIVSYRLHTQHHTVSALLLDGRDRMCCAVTIELPLRRVEGTRIRYLRGSRLWEVTIWPDRFELSRDRTEACVLGRDEEALTSLEEALGS